MATLEKIRSKSVFLIIVIGAALLAFIIGDALTNSRNLFGDHNTVAKVGDVKVEYPEYQKKREELNNRLETARRQNPAQMSDYDTQVLAQMAIQELTAEKLLDRGVKELGLETSGDQLRFYMLEQVINPEMGTLIRSMNENGLGVQTPQQAYELIFNPKRNGLTEAQMAPFQNIWLAMEEQTKQLIKRDAYQRLVIGSVKANDLDRKALYNDYVNTAKVTYAYKPYGTLDAKTYPVSDSELKKAYEEKKNEFRIEEPTKEVSLIAVTIAPSNADIEAARKLAQATKASLSDSTGNLSEAARKEGVQVTRHEVRASDLPAGLIKNYVTTAPRDSVSIVAESINGFTVIKMGGRTQEVDSIQLDLVHVVGETLPARVMAALNNGLSVDSLSSKFGADSLVAQSGQWVELFTAQGPTKALDPGQLDSLTSAAGKYINLISAPQGATLARLAKKNAPVEVYKYDEYNYTLRPSQTTIQGERDKLDKYVADNNTAEKFKANAAGAGYNVRELSLTQSSPALPRIEGMNSYYPESRQVVRWVMIDGKPGQVSHVYEADNYTSEPVLYAVAVNDSYEDYVPMTNAAVKGYLTDRVRREKAGQKMSKELEGKGKTVGELAVAMGVQPAEQDNFRFSPAYGMGSPKVVGRVMGTQKGTQAVIVEGQDGLYVFQIDGNKQETFPYDEAQYSQQYYQLLNPDLGAMLRGSAKVKNNAYKFEAGD